MQFGAEIGAGDQLAEARQETGQRLARPGRRDQQDIAACLRGPQHIQLVLTRLPAAAAEPATNRIWQGIRQAGSRCG